LSVSPEEQKRIDQKIQRQNFTRIMEIIYQLFKDTEKFTLRQMVEQLKANGQAKLLNHRSFYDFWLLLHFKEHKRLQKQLEENKNIEERVNHFVEQYQNLHQEQQKWLQDKQRAKSFFELTKAEKEENERQQQS